jgi:hypothetical protein
VAAFGCGDDDPAADDAGPTDAATADVMRLPDALPLADAEPPADGWPLPDAGPIGDAGIVPNALYSVCRDDALLRRVNPVNGATFDQIAMTLEGEVVIGATGLAARPSDGQLFVLLKVESVGSRLLGTVDATTGVVTLVGDTGDKFANIAFDGLGALYAITGDGAAVPSTAFTVSTSDASSALAQQLGNGDDGEAIGWNPPVGFMYHASGLADARFEIVDLVSALLDLPYEDGNDPGEVLAMTWSLQHDAFIAVAQNGAGDPSWVTISSLAEMTPLASPAGYRAKGLAYTFAP